MPMSTCASPSASVLACRLRSGFAIGGRVGADDVQRHLDVGRGRIVRVHRPHPHRDRLVAPVLEPVQLQAQQRQRRIAHQPADRVLPEALERAAVVAFARRQEAPVPAAVGEQRQRASLAGVGGHQDRRRLAVAALQRRVGEQRGGAVARPRHAVDPLQRRQPRPPQIVVARVEQQRRHRMRASLRRQPRPERVGRSDRRRRAPVIVGGVGGSSTGSTSRSAVAP